MNVSKIEWLDAPPEGAWNAANALLDRLGVSPETAELPLPPRLWEVGVGGGGRGVPEKGWAVAAVLRTGERGSPDLLALTEGNWQPQTQRVFEQLRRRISGRDSRASGDAAILQAVLAAFP